MLKINNLITRARLCKVHTLVLNHIKSKLGSKKNEKKQEALFADIDAVFREVAQANKLSTGDFPTAKLFTDSFAKYLLRPIYMEYLYVEFVCKCIYVYFTYILDGAGTGYGSES